MAFPHSRIGECHGQGHSNGSGRGRVHALYRIAPQEEAEHSRRVTPCREQNARGGSESGSKGSFPQPQARGRSGLRDLSKKHDEYLYGRKRRPLEGREVVGEESYKKILQELDSTRKKWR